LSALVSTALAADAPDYLRDIKPLLKNRCSSCHGSLKQKAGLRLDAGSLTMPAQTANRSSSLTAPGEVP
jgi:hypothetical protein